MKNKFSLIGRFLMIAAALALLVPLTAQATSFTWSGGVNSNWVQTTSPYDWTGGSSSNGRYPGQTHTNYTDLATINSATNNPVTLSSAVTLGGLTIGSSAGDTFGNALTINSSGILEMQGGISNVKNITLNGTGALRNDGTSGTHYAIGGSGGTVTLTGGAISSSAGGIWDFNQAVSGYGTISAPVTNNSTVTANNATALNITGAFTNSGTLNAGTSIGSPTGLLVFGTGGSLSGNAANVYGTASNNTASTMALSLFNLYGGTLNGSHGYTNASTWGGYGTIQTLTNTGTLNANNAVTPLTLSGTTTNTGGTLASSGGSFVNSGNLNGYGTIAAALANNGNITSNTSGQTFLITGNVTDHGNMTSASGAKLDLRSIIAGNNNSGSFGGATITASAGGEVDLNGATLSNLYLSGPAATSKFNLTGDSSIGGTVNYSANGTFNFNGHTLNMLAGNAPNSGASLGATGAINLDTGTLNNSTNYTANLGGTFNLAGGNITSTGGGSIQGGGIYGWGTISAPLIPIGSSAIVEATGSGKTLFINGNVDFTNGGNLVSSSGATLDLHSTINSDASPGGYVNPNGGTVNLDAAILNGLVTMRTGAVNVTNDSTMTGTINSESTLGINSGKKLNMSGATVNLNNGSLTNQGTLVIGAGTLNNATASAYTLGGGGSATLAGGSITGSHGFTSDNAVSGYGNLSALFSNNGSMTISGGILNVTGSGQIKGTGDVAISGSGLNLQNGNSLLASNFSMGPTATLQTGANTLDLTGNFSFQQTDKANAWNTNGTAGLGPNLKMAGTGVQTLEVGGVDFGANINGMTNNFALNSLTIGVGATVQLVDLFSNAGTAGNEVLYLGALLLGGVGDPTFDLNGILCYVDGAPLGNGDYHGITIEGAQVPIPPSAMLLGTGLLGLVGLGWRRKKFSQA
jgi:hypothetical protein